MGKHIEGLEDYASEFKGADSARALTEALDIRKFEIGLYWQRATYFWTLIGAAFAAYALVRAEVLTPEPSGARLSSDQQLVLFLISCIGFVLTLAWYLVNRGSKYWQENWERHVDALEDGVMGPLYKTTLAWSHWSWFRPGAGFPHSVSQINQYVSLYVTIFWIFLMGESAPFKLPMISGVLSSPEALGKWIGVLTIVASVTLMLLTRPYSKSIKDRKVIFRLHSLAPDSGTPAREIWKRNAKVGLGENAAPYPGSLPETDTDEPRSPSPAGE